MRFEQVALKENQLRSNRLPDRGPGVHENRGISRAIVIGYVADICIGIDELG